MAEKALYDNYDEPDFPFDLIRPKLSWLPEYVATHTSPRDLSNSLLNTILLFGRARTSALLPRWHVVNDLVDRLNAAAQAVGATHHLLEIDDDVLPRGMIFVVCRRSPRYKWTRPLTHRDIGRNLDYFAPGHWSMDLNQRTCAVDFIDRGNLRQLTCEGVFVEALEDPHVVQEFHAYNKVRETLYNFVMEQFGLEHRFKCVLRNADILNNITQTIGLSGPPTPDWWEANCFFVNGHGFPGLNVDPTYFWCGYRTKFRQHWGLIRKTFHFVVANNRIEFRSLGTAYWTALHSVLLRIKAICEADPRYDYESALQEIDATFQDLGKVAARSALIPATLPQLDKASRPPMPSLFERFYRNILRFLRLNTYERFKLRGRLVRPSVDYPKSGDEIVFR
jgi:hypothetical protein